jgi:tetratricopeptide (TPR) repeat protein
MRRILIGLALTLIAIPAWAQTRDENRAQCMSDDLDTQISGCTADIQSGLETVPADLAIAYYNRGRAYENKALHDQAIADYTEAIALRPNDADTYSNRGSIYELIGQRDKALSDYRAALNLRPNDALSTSGLQRLGATP